MAPSPLRDKNVRWSKETIMTLMAHLRPYDLTKSELLMIVNLRPTSAAALGAVVEEMENRFPDSEAQENMLKIITDVLGHPDEEAEKIAMSNISKEAKGKQLIEEEYMDKGI
jgi:fructose-1,6-bisphosphatase/inositol monophosphatase family enzyme